MIAFSRKKGHTFCILCVPRTIGCTPKALKPFCVKAFEYDQVIRNSSLLAGRLLLHPHFHALFECIVNRSTSKFAETHHREVEDLERCLIWSFCNIHKFIDPFPICHRLGCRDTLRDKSLPSYMPSGPYLVARAAVGGAGGRTTFQGSRLSLSLIRPL